MNRLSFLCESMKKTVFLLLVVTFGFAWSCKHAPESDDAALMIPAESLYLEAMEFYRVNNYIDAFDAFQKCRTRYPISEWGVKAELKMADCLYYQKNYETAFIQYQEFTRLHPTYTYIDYAYYQMGMCYYNQVCSIDRDQSFTREAVKHFEKLLSLFPASAYAGSARERIGECRKNLAEHVLYIGNFYYRTGAYDAALHRYLEALNDYHDYLQSPDLLLFQLGKLSLRLNRPDDARKQFLALLKEHPESPYAPLGETLLEDPAQIEEIDKIKVLSVLEKANPIRAIKAIPVPFVGEKEEEEEKEP